MDIIAIIPITARNKINSRVITSTSCPSHPDKNVFFFSITAFVSLRKYEPLEGDSFSSRFRTRLIWVKARTK